MRILQIRKLVHWSAANSPDCPRDGVWRLSDQPHSNPANQPIDLRRLACATPQSSLTRSESNLSP